MFTGIIKAVGQVAELRPKGGDLRLVLRSPEFDWSAFESGESIAVNGVCLTAVDIRDDGFATDVSRETLQVTALGELSAGSPVNLEPSLALGERLGGHLVSGHVDCVARVVERHSDARSIRFDIELPADYARYVARKGSVCLDGVSLTVNAVSGRRFSVNIIPHTAGCTTLGGWQTGTRINVEVDMLMRYLERLMDSTSAADEDSGLTREKLEAHGYA